MGTRKNKGEGEDVGQRMTEMLDEQAPAQDLEVVRDNTPPPGQSLQQLDGALISDYNKVDAMEKAGNIDKEFVRSLAERMLAVAHDPQLSRMVSFDAQHASNVLYELISGQQRQRLIEYYRITEYR